MTTLLQEAMRATSQACKKAPMGWVLSPAGWVFFIQPKGPAMGRSGGPSCVDAGDSDVREPTPTETCEAKAPSDAEHAPTA
jgi:hypothetical protein